MSLLRTAIFSVLAAATVAGCERYDADDGTAAAVYETTAASMESNTITTGSIDTSVDFNDDLGTSSNTNTGLAPAPMNTDTTAQGMGTEPIEPMGPAGTESPAANTDADETGASVTAGGRVETTDQNRAARRGMPTRSSNQRGTMNAPSTTNADGTATGTGTGTGTNTDQGTGTTGTTGTTTGTTNDTSGTNVDPNTGTAPSGVNSTSSGNTTNPNTNTD